MRSMGAGMRGMGSGPDSRWGGLIAGVALIWAVGFQTPASTTNNATFNSSKPGTTAAWTGANYPIKINNI
jgi:hypothetical protein